MTASCGVSISSAPSGSCRVLQKVLRDDGANVFTAEMLDTVAASLARFDRLAEQPFVAFFEPPSLDDRIVNQFALFSLMSSPAASFGDWVEAHHDLARRIVIPAALKWEVRDKLDQANVTERVLYPGLDGLSRWLRRQYAPRVEVVGAITPRGVQRGRKVRR
jgi:hypothetical protein